MNLKFLILCISFFISLNSFAKITASVVKFKGTVLYNGKKIDNDTIFEKNGIIQVKQKSYLKMKVIEYNSHISLGPNSKLTLKYSKGKKKRSPFFFKAGVMRWITQGESKSKGFIRTKTVAMGVRGTDFLVVVSELLGETEIYCFDGKVLFANRKNKKDSKTVKRNDWAGIGGRFSPNVGAIIPMTEEQITHVKGMLD
jgi:hypothetical protein